NADSAQAFLLDQASFKRRRGPLRGIELLDVIHEVNADGSGCTGIKSAKDPGLARCGHNFDRGKSRVTSELRHVLRTLRIIAALGGDRGESDPVLQPLDVFVVQLRYLAQHRLEVRIICSEGKLRQSSEGACSKRSLDEFSTINRIVVRISHCVLLQWRWRGRVQRRSEKYSSNIWKSSDEG